MKAKKGILGLDDTACSTSKKAPFISLCMIVKDEEKEIGRCLSSIAPIVHEIIIVDTGSSDRTKDIAIDHGAKVIDHIWKGDFSEARNVSLAHSGGEWVLVLDADEIIAKRDLAKLTETCLSGGFKAYTMVTRNYTPDSRGANWVPNDGSYNEVKGLPGWFPSEKVRLFKRHGSIRFEGVVHELVDPSIKKLGWQIGVADVPVHHFGRLDAGRQNLKERVYLRLADKKVAGVGRKAKAFYERGVQGAELGFHENAVKDFLRAKEMNPGLPHIDTYLSASLVELGKCDEAISIIEKALSREPGSPGLWNNLGLAHYVSGDYDQAIVSLKRCVRLNSSYASAWKNLGMSYTRKNSISEAIGAFQTALQLNPAMAEVRKTLKELGRIRNGTEPRNKQVDLKVLVFEAESGVIGEDCIEALQSMGCSTVRCPVKEAGHDSCYNPFDMVSLMGKIVNFGPELILSINQNGLDREGVMAYACRELGIPVFVWYVDNPFSMRDWNHYEPPPNVFFLVFDARLAAELDQVRPGSVFHLPLGTNPHRFRPMSLEPEEEHRYGCDVSFVGNLDLNKAKTLRKILNRYWDPVPKNIEAMRNSIISRIAENSSTVISEAVEEEMGLAGGGLEFPNDNVRRLFEIGVEFEASSICRANVIRQLIRDKSIQRQEEGPCRIKIFGGSEWRNVVGPERLLSRVSYKEELFKIYNSSTINLNISRVQLRTGLNQRVFDVPACRGFLITDHKKEIEDCFVVGKEVVCYRNVNEIPRLIDYYLKHDKERKKIAEAGFKRVMKDHTYARRMATLLEIYDEVCSRSPHKGGIPSDKKTIVRDLIGRGHLMAGRADKAIPWFLASIEGSTEDGSQGENLGFPPLLYYHLGRCYQDKGETDLAQDAFSRASGLTPGPRLDIQLALCQAFARQLDMESCLHHCGIILKQLDLDANPVMDSIKDIADLFSRIGHVLNKTGLVKETLLAHGTSEYLMALAGRAAAQH